MSPDTLRKLISSANGTNKATPDMVNRVLHPEQYPKEIRTIDDVLTAVESSIMSEFVRQSGSFNGRKYTTFQNDLKELLPQFGAVNLTRITNECICPDGRVNTTKLLEIISKNQTP